MKATKINKRYVCKKGIALVTAVVVLGILLAVSLGISAIIVIQIKTIRSMGYSVQAYFTAETGIERTLYEILVKGSTESSFSDSLGGASYSVKKINGDGTNGCNPGNTCIESIGTFMDTKRAIRVTF